MNDVKFSDGLAFRMFGVYNGVVDYTSEETFENTTGLLVDGVGYTLDTTTAGQTTNGGAFNAIDCIAWDFAVPLSVLVTKTLAIFSMLTLRFYLLSDNLLPRPLPSFPC